MENPGNAVMDKYYPEFNRKIKANIPRFTKAAVRNATRIKLLYVYLNEIENEHPEFPPLFIPSSQVKNFERAESLKVKANELFIKKHKNLDAIKVYNEAIQLCPQDTEEGKKLYAILIANRSAVFFDAGNHEKVLQDVAFLKQDGRHPKLEKVIIRATKSLEALNKSLANANKPLINQDQSFKTVLPEEYAKFLEAQNNSNLQKYPALSPALNVKHSNHKIIGRYVVSKAHITPGEILGVEKPYASVIIGKNNCGHCAKSTNLIYACADCTQIYCSLGCLEEAKRYHKFECGVSHCLKSFEPDAPETLPLMAMRMITQRPVAQVVEEMEYSVNSNRKVEVYRTADFYNVSKLVRHPHFQRLESKLLLSTFAALIMKALKMKGYFQDGADAGAGDNGAPPDVGNYKLTKDEVMVARSLLLYMEMLQFNMEDIFELPGVDGKIGAGLYPTLALFNHSCDPHVVRCYIDNILVLRAIKPIKPGEHVTINYGNISYFDSDQSEREDILEERYLFNCLCEPCLEDWLIAEFMDPRVTPLKCKCGGVIYSYNHEENVCDRCRKKNRQVAANNDILNMYLKIHEANNEFEVGHFEEAMKMFADIVSIQHRIFAPPHMAMVKAQKRLEACIHHLGNKSFDYKFDINNWEYDLDLPCW